MDPVQRGTTGMPIRLTLLDAGAVFNPAAATVKIIRYTKPDYTTLNKTAVSGTDSQGRPCLEYTTQAGDLDMPGLYRVQAYVEDSAGKWPSASVSFRVH